MSEAEILLTPKPLSAAAFTPYGDVIAMEGTPIPINNGKTDRFHDLAQIDPGADGRAIVNIFRSSPVTLPFAIRQMENHPLGSQAFMPLDGRPYLVVVAPAGPFAPSKLEAFRAEGHQGVNFRKGVWHHFNLALESESRFLVIDRAGPGANLEEVFLTQPVTLAAAIG